MTFRFILWLSLCGLVGGCLNVHPAQSNALCLVLPATRCHAAA
uniref:Lipoprotein n=1 Tax=Chloracidobacterium thermophilum TaxID=458033 RepID=A8DJD5_9BACT|nr:hypothetical protein YS_M60-F11.028 [Chloracidobacterium thermophilum]